MLGVLIETIRFRRAWQRFKSWWDRDGPDKIITVAVSTFVVGLVLLIPLVIYAAIRDSRDRQYAPCSEFANEPAKDVPMRCLKCTGGVELTK